MIKQLKWAAVIGVGVLSMQAFAATSTSTSSTTSTAAQSSTQQVTKLNNQTDKLSYTIGVDLGENFKNNGVSINPAAVTQGMQDAIGGKTLLMTKDEMQQTIQTFQKQVVAKREAEFTTEAAKNLKTGQTFLTKNKTQSGVKTLADGLQYKVITPGTGASPTATDTVTVNYSGSFVDGTVFDSSYKRGKPATFPLSEVIKGWQEALTHMKTGATWELYIPANLAYGEQGMGNVIGPNETLIFKIQLISINNNSSSSSSKKSS